MKKILILFFCFIFLFLIYETNKAHNIYYNPKNSLHILKTRSIFKHSNSFQNLYGKEFLKDTTMHIVGGGIIYDKISSKKQHFLIPILGTLGMFNQKYLSDKIEYPMFCFDFLRIDDQKICIYVFISMKSKKYAYYGNIHDSGKYYKILVTFNKEDEIISYQESGGII